MSKYVAAAYFDLDGTLLDASSEKTLTAELAKKRPWRIPFGVVMWSLGSIGNLLRGRSIYDATRNRGHFSLSSWETLESISQNITKSKLLYKVSDDAKQCLEWHRTQGHRLILVTATIGPMADAIGKELGMDKIYACGPENRTGILSGSERGWLVPRRKGKVPVVLNDAEINGHDLSKCYGYGNTMADSWFMGITGNPVAINPERKLRKHSIKHGWEIRYWKI